MNRPLVFLKLGGSLLGDKRKERSFRAGVVRRLGGEIARAARDQGLRLLLAHGGGCFAHRPAKRYRTREGLPGGGGWRGFAETRRGVMEMNRRVLDALAAGGLHPVLISPVAGAVARRGRVAHWDTRVIRAALDAGQTPMVHGDVLLDPDLGFTILSTEELFQYLAVELKPRRIVLACDVPGVCCDIMHRRSRADVIPCIDGANVAKVRRMLRGGRTARVHDVTGGMAAKVEQLHDLARRMPGLEALILSGRVPGAVESALRGDAVGTLIRA